MEVHLKLTFIGFLFIALSSLMLMAPTMSSEPITNSSCEGDIMKSAVNYTVKESVLLQNDLNMTVNETVYLAVPQNTTYQEAVLLNFDGNYRFIRDEDGNVMILTWFKMPPHERRWVNSTFRIAAHPYRITFGNCYVWPNFTLVKEYTTETRYWDIKNRTLIDITKSVVDGAEGPVEVAGRIAKWLSSRIEYRVLPTRAGSDGSLFIKNSKVILIGDCSEVSDVYVTMARIAGLPARVAFGMLLENRSRTFYWINTSQEEFEQHWGGHAWSQVYIPRWGWVDVELLEGFLPKVGDYSWRHVVYGFEAKKFAGSAIEEFVLPSFSRLRYVSFTFTGG